MMKGGRFVVFARMLVVGAPERDKLHFQRLDLLPCSLREWRERGQRAARAPAISWISGFRSSAIFSDFPPALPLSRRPPFFLGKNFDNGLLLLCPLSARSPAALCSPQPFPLCSLFFPLLSMWNNMSYAISMARLCYLWVRERSGGKGATLEGRREGKGYHFGRGMNRDVDDEPNSRAISPLSSRRAIRYRLPT